MYPTLPSLRRVLPACAALSLLGAVAGAADAAPITLAKNGAARCVIVQQADATPAERHAAEELAQTLQAITGAAIPIRGTLPTDDTVAILVGPGAAASAAFPDIDLTTFHGEEIAERTRGRLLLLAGGRPRGTLYAVERFLQDQCGVRWWAPWATDIPHRATLTVRALNVRAEPAFEYREPYWFPAKDGAWASRNGNNGNLSRLTEEEGGKVAYTGGFVHTAYDLVPPSENFAAHPEWYSLINGNRTVDNAQLCLTNQALRDYVVERVRDILRKDPDARIISISQNDNVRFCQCPNCAALDAREGSHAGSMIDFVNYVAGKLGPEFPNVAFDTLAYQYTRHPPKTVRPLPNVIVRLCSIECNFAEPFDHPSNAAFFRDLTDWSNICNRLYVWDYSTDFANYIQPHPNWFVLGPDIRLFHQYHVKGVFSEGAYESAGAEMGEMRSWVLARLMWDPSLDDRKLIDEFLNGYYGRAAAPYIRRYMDLMQGAAKGVNLTCYTPVRASFLNVKTLAKAESLWQQAEAASKNDPERLWRVREGHLPVRYVFLSRWQAMRGEAEKTGVPWPLPESRKVVADEWRQIATGPGPVGWTPVTNVHEGAPTVTAFLARFDRDPEPTPPLSPRNQNPPPPTDLTALGAATIASSIDVQDDVATLAQEGEWAEFHADPTASDGMAVRMPGDHHEWAFQIPYEQLPKAARDTKKRWKVYVVARVQAAPNGGDSGDAFTAGVWNGPASKGRAETRVTLRDALAAGTVGYRSYSLGSVAFAAGDYLWVAPTANPNVTAIWIDRIFLVPDESK